MTTQLMIHHDGDLPITGEATSQEHEHSNGPYAVVKLKIGSHEICVFPKGQGPVEMAEAFEQMAASLRGMAEAVGCEAQALRD